MSPPVHLLGISGSLRRASYNTKLLHVAAEHLPDGTTLELAEIGDLPLYNADVEAQGMPATVRRFRNQIAAADGLLIATPEYNYSIPGVLKNAIDWASRPPDAPINHLPAAIMGAGGRSGTARAQAHLRQILLHNRLWVVPREVLVPGAWHAFDDDGRLREPELANRIARLLAELVELVRRRAERPNAPAVR